MPEPLAYRPAVGILLLNQRREIFVGQRRDSSLEVWQMPQGGIDNGETAEQAMWRELGEEVGTSKAEILAESEAWLDYDLPTDLQGKLWGGRFRGQRQKWFALRFTGTDADIAIDTPEPEFRAWMWATPARALELVVPFKRGLYATVLNEFAALLGS